MQYIDNFLAGGLVEELGLDEGLLFTGSAGSPAKTPAIAAKSAVKRESRMISIMSTDHT